MIHLELYAAAAYAAYSESVGGKAYNGDPLPKWDALPERIKTAWKAAAEAVVCCP